MDTHWKPVRDLCQPCLINYDLICNFETLNFDTERVLEEANVPADIIFPVRVGVTSQINTQKYFSELSPQTFRQLADIYRDDFHLFGYDPNVLSTN
jgi:Sulfotransferase family